MAAKSHKRHKIESMGYVWRQALLRLSGEFNSGSKAATTAGDSALFVHFCGKEIRFKIKNAPQVACGARGEDGFQCS
jgi:hypothetical protein